jgi:hypothetical protein
MKSYKFGVSIFLILAILLINLSIISAGFTISENGTSFSTEYGPNEKILGKINISFNKESANSLFKDSFGNQISLIELLKSDISLNYNSYSCSPLNCEPDYATTTESTTKSFTLNEGEFKIIGLKISGSSITDISKFSMNFESDAGYSSTSQLQIDFFNDGISDWKANLPSAQFGIRNYSCYNENHRLGRAEITTTSYCQKFYLNETPAVKIGAKVEKVSGSEEVEFKLEIFSEDYSVSESCIAKTSSSGEIFCIPEDLEVEKPGNFFVCIETKSSADNNKYAIGYEQNESCGYSGFLDDEYNFDFEIFVEQAKYGKLVDNIFVLNKTEIEKFESYNIEDQILDYIDERYDGKCNEGCVIPIKFTSKVNNQKIYLNNLALSYVAGISTTSNKFYDLEEEPAEIISNYILIDFSNSNFSTPNVFGKKTFSLYLDNKKIFSKIFEIKRKPIIESIKPTITAAALPTLFEVKVNSFGKNITKYEWNFHNFSKTETAENKFSFTYSNVGNYILEIKVVDSEGLESEKNFTISVEAPIDAVNKTLIFREANIKVLEGNIEDYDLFEKGELREILNLTSKKAEIGKIRNSFNSALISTSSTNQTYIDLMKKLIELDFPDRIETVRSGDTLVYFPNEEIIDVNFLNQITNEQFSQENVLNWYENNINSELTFKEIYEVNGNIKTKLISIFYINIENKASENPIMVIKKMENLKFDGTNPFENSEGDYFYKELDDESENLKFSTTEENVDFSNLPFFISPKEIEVEPISDPDRDYTLVIILIMVALTLGAILVYIIMHVWYKKKYESSLFGNRNDLYNLVHYLNNSKKKGLSEEEIKNNLRKSKWSSEQISYVLKKYANKNTGLPGIPIDKIVEKLTKKRRNSFNN